MFENFFIDVETSRKTNKHKRLKRLLLKHIEQAKANELTSLNALDAKKQSKTYINQLRKKHKPEESYEIWHTQGSPTDQKLNSSSKKRKTDINKKSSKKQHVVVAESEISELHSDDSDSTMLDEYQNSTAWTKAQFAVQIRGLEVLPSITSMNLDKDNLDQLSNNVNFTKYHVTMLKNLLHINIFKKNWNIAYKIFCCIIRSKNVDIRSIWPLGIEILTRQREEYEMQHNPLLIHLPDKEKRARMLAKSDHLAKVLKDDKFFEWLSRFYPVPLNVQVTYRNKHYSAPVWRSGSKTHTPLYIITSMWSALVKNDLKSVNDMLDEYLLIPPFSNDGIFYFFKALSRHLEVSQAVDSQDLSNPAIVKNLTKLLDEAVETLRKCEELGFEIPHGIIDVDLRKLRRTLEGEDNGPEDSSSDDGEYTSEKKPVKSELDLSSMFEDTVEGDEDAEDEQLDIKNDKDKMILDNFGSEDEEEDEEEDKKHTKSHNTTNMDFDFEFD